LANASTVAGVNRVTTGTAGEGLLDIWKRSATTVANIVEGQCYAPSVNETHRRFNTRSETKQRNGSTLAQNLIFAKALSFLPALGLLLYSKQETDPQIGQGPIDYEGCIGSFLKVNIAHLRNGLSDAENLELFATPDLDRIISLLLKGLGKAFEPHDSR
jgi:hypothetical protein